MEFTDKIMPLTEFETLPEEEQLQLLGHWRNIHGVKGIRDVWELDPNNYYKIARRVGLPSSRGIDKSIPTVVRRDLSDARSQVAVTTTSPESPVAAVSPASDESSTAFTTTLIGEYSGQVIANRLMMLASLMLNDTDTKYKVNLKIESK